MNTALFSPFGWRALRQLTMELKLGALEGFSTRCFSLWPQVSYKRRQKSVNSPHKHLTLSQQIKDHQLLWLQTIGLVKNTTVLPHLYRSRRGGRGGISRALDVGGGTRRTCLQGLPAGLQPSLLSGAHTGPQGDSKSLHFDSSLQTES